MAKYFEDIVVGASDRFGQREVTREAVIAFAERFDPQPFHLDDAAAAATFFGKVSASGWHTAAMTMSMLVEQQHAEGFQSAGSPGVDELRFLRPVYPGDVLSCGRTILEKRNSSSRPELGIYREEISAYNQHGEKVLNWKATAFALVREE
jgi:acyl dehydratase